MKVLVTGGAGFIGSHVAERYVSAGHEVVVVDDLSHGDPARLPAGVELHQLDVCDRAALTERFLHAQPDVVNHHAALVSVRHSVEEPERTYRVNLDGTRNVVAAAHESGARRLILASSGGAVYGEPEDLPVSEAHPLRPLSPYGRSKALAEAVVLAADIPSVVLRYSNVYGPGQDPGNGNGAVAIFGERMLAGQPLTLYGNGEQVRDYLFVNDAAGANLAALNRSASGIYNIGTGRGHSLLELIDRLAGALGRQAEWSSEKRRPYEVWRNVLDPGAAARDLGWRAEHDLESGLMQTVDWLRSRQFSMSQGGD